jgi:rhodanese-related sulfurtransferase
LLLILVNNNEVIVLDIRPEKEFLSGHLPNAINIPPNEIIKRINKLDNTKTMVAYCRGPYCLYSQNAVKLLQEYGFKAKRLESGFPEWKTKNYPIYY